MFKYRPYKRNNNITNYNPFNEMKEVEKEFLADPNNEFLSYADVASFKTDIRDEGDHYLLVADLPGFEKNNIKLEVSGDVLTINAERKSEHMEEDKENKYICRERSYGKYTRQFDVSAVEVNMIKAKCENGVLTLTMPKKQDTIPETKHLEIE